MKTNSRLWVSGVAIGVILIGSAFTGEPALSAWEGPQSRRPAPSPSMIVPLPVMLKLCRDHLLAMNTTLNDVEVLTAEARKTPDKAAKERALAKIEAALPEIHAHMVECLALIEAEQARQSSPGPGRH